MTRTERLLRLARQRGDRAAELILTARRCDRCATTFLSGSAHFLYGHNHGTWTEAELREAWGR